MQGLFQLQESCPGSVEHLQTRTWSGTTTEVKNEGEWTICVHKSPPGSFPWKFNLGLVVPYLPAPGFPLPTEGAAPGLVGSLLLPSSIIVCTGQNSPLYLLISIICPATESL